MSLRRKMETFTILEGVDQLLEEMPLRSSGAHLLEDVNVVQGEALYEGKGENLWLDAKSVRRKVADPQILTGVYKPFNRTSLQSQGTLLMGLANAGDGDATYALRVLEVMHAKYLEETGRLGEVIVGSVDASQGGLDWRWRTMELLFFKRTCAWLRDEASDLVYIFHQESPMSTSSPLKTKFPKIAEDRLSSLPKNVIEKILSRLPLKDVVRTRVLSRVWRYELDNLPQPVFRSIEFPMSPSQSQIEYDTKLVRTVEQVLLTHRGPIHKFFLCLDIESTIDIDRWVLFVARNGLKEFTLLKLKGQTYKVPSTLFLCEGLTLLRLYRCTLMPPASFKGFKNLRVLYLDDVSFSELSDLFGCLPAMRRLELFGDTFEILAAGHVPDRLPTSCELLHLSIEMNLDDKQQVSAALWLFRSCSLLQNLEIWPYTTETGPNLPVQDLWESQEDFNCLFTNLQTLSVEDYILDTPGDLKFIEFVLAKAPSLRMVKLIVSEKKDIALETMTKLIRFRRMSSKAEIVITNEPGLGL